MIVGTDLVLSAYARSLRLRNRSQTTISSYAFTYGQLTKWAGKPASTCTRAEIEQWLSDRLDVVSARRVAQDTLHLKIFFAWAVRAEYVTDNPMRLIRIENVESEPRRVMGASELKAILAACKGPAFIDVRDLAVCRILCEVGSPRLGELISMTVDAVDFGHDLLRLTGKTGTRHIPLGDRTALALERYLKVRAKHRHAESDRLWLGKMGPLGRGGFQEMIKRRAALAGFPGPAFPHLFRHATLSRASEAGMPDSLLEPLYGWTDGSVQTRKYGAATRAVRAQQAARKLGLGDQL